MKSSWAEATHYAFNFDLRQYLPDRLALPVMMSSVLKTNQTKKPDETYVSLYSK